MRKWLLRKIPALFVILILLCMIILPVDASAESKDKIIKIFHTNDVHSRVDNYTKAKHYMDNQTADGKLLLDAGDTYHGQSFATLEEGSSIAKVLKEMGYVAMVPGNHDFNYGQDRLRELSNESGVKVLAANITKDGKPAYDEYMIKEVDGVKFGIFGITTPETAYKTNPKNVIGLDFGTKEQIIEKSQSIVNKLKSEGADVIIGLTHLGIDPSSEVKSTDIANSVNGIDIIIDGHSHSTLDKYTEANKLSKTKITSTGEYLKNLGEITLTLDNDNKIKDIKLANVPMDGYTGIDLNIKNIIDNIKEGQNPILNTIVGYTPIKLEGDRSVVRSNHSNLGRLLTSAMLAETGAEIALTNGGGIRDSIEARNITKGDIIRVLPFGNYIVTKKLTGAEIIGALDYGMVNGAGSFPHFAGMEVIAGTYNEINNKVISVKVNGKPIDLNKEYLVATNDFLAVGGDGYRIFTEKPIINEFKSLDEALIDYISKVGEEGIKKIDKENRLIRKAMPTLEEAKPILEEAIKSGSNINVSNFDDKNVLVAITNKEGEVINFLIVNSTVKEVNGIIEEYKNDNSIEPNKPNEGNNTNNSDNQVKPNENNNKLPYTGGVSSKALIFLGVLLIGSGIFLYNNYRVKKE